MDIFDKATKAVKEVGSSVVNTAASVGSSIGNATRADRACKFKDSENGN